MAHAAATSPAGDGLNVIALVSGGKDSFFSLLHCRANGHRVVALANLHPARPPPPDDADQGPCSSAAAPALAASAAVSGTLSAGDVAIKSSSASFGGLDQGQDQGPAKTLSQATAPESLRSPDEDERDEQDLNSFMYQTVGHEVISLYAEATGIPLYRRAITGTSGQHGKDYSHHERGHPTAQSQPTPGPGSGPEDSPAGDYDETESMIPLLRAIKAAHPEANAICAGAILSTYQRTRVESVATRLGLVPVAYLWKFPVLPAPSPSPPGMAGDAQLLDDMATIGLEARIIKVASGGLDDSFLWTNLASASGKHRVSTTMRRYGTQETGAVIGEGGEFETLILDGPSTFFRKRIVVAEEDRRIIREGGGNVWLKLRNARLEAKDIDSIENGPAPHVRIPDLLDIKFSSVLGGLDVTEMSPAEAVFPQGTTIDTPSADIKSALRLSRLQGSGSAKVHQWCLVRDSMDGPTSIEEETKSVVKQIRWRLQQATLTPSAIINTTILLRRMADFFTVNTIYGALFDAPNPPSRVTVSCGDLFSKDPSINIAVYLTVHHGLRHGQRQGLHVQSRSYWAPANIGPYSQAITIPVASLASTTNGSDATLGVNPKLVSIAGQIPLVPATMALPAEGGLPLQLTLSLQHLWRIGLEMGVQWWSSAVAYFPLNTNADNDTMSRKAQLASKAWETAHVWTENGDEDSDDDDAGPDLWDRRFNSQYQTFGGGGSEIPTLPDWSVLAAADADGKMTVPPLFAAEVAELPRAAGVEWHAHLGFAGVSAACVWSYASRVVVEGGGLLDVYHCVLKSASGTSVVQTVVAERSAQTSGGEGRKITLGQGGVDGVAKMVLEKLQEGSTETGELVAVVRYVDVKGEEFEGERDGMGSGPVVPCASLWDRQGRALASVTVYQSVFEGLAGSN